jgi:hypothetical protein
MGDADLLKNNPDGCHTHQICVKNILAKDIVRDGAYRHPYPYGASLYGSPLSKGGRHYLPAPTNLVLFT